MGNAESNGIVDDDAEEVEPAGSVLLRLRNIRDGVTLWAGRAHAESNGIVDDDAEEVEPAGSVLPTDTKDLPHIAQTLLSLRGTDPEPDQDAMDFVISEMIMVDLTNCPKGHALTLAVTVAMNEGVIFNRADAHSLIRIRFISPTTHKVLYTGSLVGIHEGPCILGKPGAFAFHFKNEQAMQCVIGKDFDENVYQVAIEQTALRHGSPDYENVHMVAME
jgi:hypothetical protein